MNKKNTKALWAVLMAVCLMVAGILSPSVKVKAADSDSSSSSAPEIPGLTFQSEMQNEFAECFHIYYYKQKLHQYDRTEYKTMIH